MAILTPRIYPRVSVAVNTFIPRFYQKALGAAVSAVIAGLVFIDSQAHAITVNVGGQNYEVTTFTGIYYGNESKFATAANGGVMPWMGSSKEAMKFALAVDSASTLGLPNILGGAPAGPLFAFQSYSYLERTDTLYITQGGFVALRSFPFWYVGSMTWAQVTSIGPSGGGDTSGGTASVPGPLPILGIAAAFGFSRKLRKRIKLYRGTSNISTSPGA